MLTICTPSLLAVEVDVEQQIRHLEDLLEHLVQGRLTLVQTHLLQDKALPRLVLLLLKIRTGPPLMERVNGFFQHVLNITVKALQTAEGHEMIHCATHILTDGINYHFYMQVITQLPHSPSREIDSQSSGEDSCSEASEDELRGASDSILRTGPERDEASPLYVQNITYFNQIGGFQAILSRLVREPRLSLTAVKILLRPFIKVTLASHTRPTFRQAHTHVSSDNPTQRH